VVVACSPLGAEDTSIAISIATLPMVFVLQNTTQNRDSVSCISTERDDLCRTRCPRGRASIEVKSEAEIKGLTLEEADWVTPGE
jgi:low affinity Fe/Cu permease